MHRFWLAVAMAALATLLPSLASADDTAISQFIIQRLKTEQQRGTLKGFHIDLKVEGGTVWYEGYVSNPQQKNMILRTAQRAKHLGVVQIVDDISVQQMQQAPVQQMPVQQMPVQQMPVQQTLRTNWVQDDVAPARPPVQAQPMNPPVSEPMPVMQQPPMQQAPMQQAPVPMQAMPNQQMGAPVQMARPMPVPASYSSGVGVSSDNPNLPPYAWPGYAAAPNYAAVTYPKTYSPTAWPYIGPFYPYPQVPLGWRRVALEWDDGWWHLDFYNRNSSW